MTFHELTAWGIQAYNRVKRIRPMSLNLQAINAGYLLVDAGRDGQVLNGWRYMLIRNEDMAVFHYDTAKQVRSQLKG